VHRSRHGHRDDRRTDLIGIDDIRAALATRAPRELAASRRAAVAIVLSDIGPGPEVLFIERAERAGDPWSGHMAFPGGRVDPSDVDARAAAERETREEVGLDLAVAESLGRLDDLRGMRLVVPLVLSAFVYRLDVRAPVVPNYEVRDAFWVPFADLFDPSRHVGHRWAGMRWPGVRVRDPDRPVVWGLTYRLLESLFATVGVAMPRRPRSDRSDEP